jgi:Aldo/keto reductase family
VYPARQRLANRFDLSLPANQGKLEATEQLAELAAKAGMTLIEMAIAFVLRHPAVTSAIIGPRTMEHLESQLTAADVEVSDEILDRIDEIVPPGLTINPADNGLGKPSPGPDSAATLAVTLGQPVEQGVPVLAPPGRRVPLGGLITTASRSSAPAVKCCLAV